MKIFLAVYSDYDEYSIIAAFDNPVMAEEAVKNGWGNGTTEIEVNPAEIIECIQRGQGLYYATAHRRVRSDEVRARYDVGDNVSGLISSFPLELRYDPHGEEWWLGGYFLATGGLPGARKMINDMRTQLIADGQWPKKGDK